MLPTVCFRCPSDLDKSQYNHNDEPRATDYIPPPIESSEVIDRPLEIRGDFTREELRRKVVEAFLDERPGNIRRVKYRYHVETMKDGRRMFLLRPQFMKGAFDFKVDVEQWGAKGTHKEIQSDLVMKKRENTQGFEALKDAIRQVHRGRDPDIVLASTKGIMFKAGWDVELLLKVLKWFFILEDVDYWSYDGRDKLMKFVERTFRDP